MNIDSCSSAASDNRPEWTYTQRIPSIDEHEPTVETRLKVSWREITVDSSAHASGAHAVRVLDLQSLACITTGPVVTMGVGAGLGVQPWAILLTIAGQLVAGTWIARHRST